jgi:hypothetical protein
LLSEGIFVEGVEWCQREPFEVVRFTYQRLSDHLITREVLKPVNCNDNRQVCNLYHSLRDLPNRLEALMIEFPTRARGKELILQIPTKEITYSALESFISGLYWRDSASFTKETDRITDYCLEDQQLRGQTYEVLFSLGIRSGHPYCASTLDRHLSRLRLPDRDLRWSEFVRTREPNSAVNKLIRFVLVPSSQVKDARMARCCVLLLKWLLTSTDRYLRDSATKALVILGTARPGLLFRETVRSLAANDPYIPERMLAASYGVAMRLYSSVKGESKLSGPLLRTAKPLYRLMFAPRAEYATTHVLMRDYARNVIGVALRLSPRLLSAPSRARLKAPYRDGGIRSWGVSSDRDQAKYRGGDAPIHADFGNYTLGRLVSNRQNYDYKHPDYQEVKQNIYWRIYDLGYELSRFSIADQAIVRASSHYPTRHPGGIDRYGKKFSWIAYFELYGHRQDLGLLDDYRFDSRPSDCDVDPSFPDEPNNKPLVSADFVGSRSTPTRHWIASAKAPSLNGFLQVDTILGNKGPWLLLDGDVSQEDLPTKRWFKMWIHSRIVTRAQLKVLRGLPFDGLDAASVFSYSPTSSYTFAGEIPWNETWPLNESDSLPFEVGRVQETQPHQRLVVYRFGKRLSDKDSDTMIDRIGWELKDSATDAALAAYLDANKLMLKTVVTRKRVKVPRTIEVSAENPVRQFSWESYHSSINRSLHLTLPSRQICESAQLRMEVPTWDFFDQKNRKAAIVVKAREQSGPGLEFVFLRKDLLDAYLRRKKAVLVWSISGERRVLFKDDDGEFREPPEDENICRKFYDLYCYDNGIISALSKIRKPRTSSAPRS